LTFTHALMGDPSARDDSNVVVGAGAAGR
jgi:hypothetical protein